MKKGVIRAAAAALFLALLAAGILAANSTQTQPGTPELEPCAERDFLRAELTYDEGTRTLRGTGTLTATNRTGQALSEAALRLMMNGRQGTSVSVSGVTVDGEAVPFTQDDEDATVLRAAFDWKSGETVDVAFTLMIAHEEAEGAAIVLLPALAMWENGAWRTDAYDELAEPGYAQAFDFVVLLDGEVAAQMRGAREAVFALDPDGKRAAKTVGGTRVTTIAPSAAAARRLLGQAQTGLESLKELGLDYPFDALTVVESGAAAQDGLSCSGLIALPKEAKREAQLQKLTRLIARQTFGTLVENDPWNAPWLSLSLSSAVEMIAYRHRKGEAAYETRFFEEIEVGARLTRPAGVCVGAGTAHFGGETEMTQVLRDQGAAMLLGIEQAVGETAFLDALRLYADQNAGGVGSLSALEEALLSVTGSDWSGYLEDELAF